MDNCQDCKKQREKTLRQLSEELQVFAEENRIITQQAAEELFLPLIYAIRETEEKDKDFLKKNPEYENVFKIIKAMDEYSFKSAHS